MALTTNKGYRNSKSPETLKIRRIVEAPMQRRYQRECCVDESPLWGEVAPRRLNVPLFNKSCKSPLEEIFTRFSKELKRIPGEKVVGVCKWKLRKMRGNLVGKKDPEYYDFQDDGFDFVAAASTTRIVRPTPRRINSAFQPPRAKVSSTTPTTIHHCIHNTHHHSPLYAQHPPPPPPPPPLLTTISTTPTTTTTTPTHHHHHHHTGDSETPRV